MLSSNSGAVRCRSDNSGTAPDVWVHLATMLTMQHLIFFLAMEMEVRRVLGEGLDLSDVVKVSIAESEDVSFFWSLVCEDWDEKSSNALLHMMVNQYVKIRGFSRASALVEQFKQKNKQTTQKSKGIRKQLIPQPIAERKDKEHEDDK